MFPLLWQLTTNTGADEVSAPLDGRDGALEPALGHDIRKKAAFIPGWMSSLSGPRVWRRMLCQACVLALHSAKALATTALFRKTRSC